MPVLDATPAGYPVYIQEGFAPAWGFRRYRREAVSLDPDAAEAPRTRRIDDRDWPAIIMCEPVVRSQVSVTCCCSRGRSARPNGIGGTTLPVVEPVETTGGGC